MTTEQPASSDTSAQSESDDQPLDDKAKFRQALERKNNRHHQNAVGGAGGSKSGAAHGAAGAQRMFRRKSG